jgi:RNA-directed DNA polymerase
MNGQGKSHRPMVLAKPPNKAGCPAAEGVEGRGLAEGNAGQQNTHRTQSRARVPSALERVRQVARRDKGGKFRVSFVLDTVIRGFYVAIDHG